MDAVAYIVRSYPRLSQTFILNEVRALERLGLRIRIFAITDPHEPVKQSGLSEISAPVRYLDAQGRRGWAASSIHARVALASPRRYVKTLLRALGSRQADTGYRVASRYRCFHYAVVLADILAREGRTNGSRIGRLHAHFAHDPTLVAQWTHLLTGIPFSFTGHARDLYQIPQAELRARAEHATSVVTCCSANVDFLRTVLPDRLRGKIALVHHGVDLGEIAPRDVGGGGTAPPLILSVGRLVEKKGFADFLLAVYEVRQSGRRFRCRIYGEGPERARLEKMIEVLRLEGHVTLTGARPRREILAAYREADLFALAPCVLEDGDRDGIPNVIIEAMASGLPVVTTAAGGIPELVTPGVTGLIVEPHDIAGIAANIGRLLDDAALRARLGSAGRAAVEERFDERRTAEEMAVLLGVNEGGAPCPAPI
ncbi:MAG TPA: glycosyltransferase [Candidatus Eisenbacteria bacterium]|jgi:glycosyltransferase involved in cell wall biosynthesis